MIGPPDWRLHGQEAYLRGVTLWPRAYTPPSDIWSQDHCEFCWATFAGDENPHAEHEGYATTARSAPAPAAEAPHDLAMLAAEAPAEEPGADASGVPVLSMDELSTKVLEVVDLNSAPPAPPHARAHALDLRALL